MSAVDFKSILGAVLVGLVFYGLLSLYETNKIAEIQNASPEDEITPPPAPVLWCVNNKLIVAFALACLILGLASYGSGARSKAERSPPSVPPARV